MNILFYFLAFIYGVVFGIANIIPSVSGGTMMVVLGCYDKVCDALALDFKHIRKNLDFLIPFAIGAASGIVGFSFAITFLFEKFPIQTYFFFIGLILGSLPFIVRSITKKEKFRRSFIAPAAIALLVVIISSIAQGSHSGEYTVTQNRLADRPNTYVVKFINETHQDIDNFHLQFEPGEITVIDGAQMFNVQGTMDKLSAIMGNEVSDEPNAVRPLGESKLGAKQTFQFTYTPSKGRSIEFEPKISYAMGFALFVKLIVGGFIAAVCMIIPGVSGSFMLVLFGIYTTIIGAIKDMDILILFPAAIGILFGLIIGAKLIKWLLENYNGMVYSIIAGLVVGSVFAIFPREISFNIQLVAGIGAMIIGGALALTIGMERKSGDELKKTGKNL